MAKKRSLVIDIVGNNKMGRAIRDAMGSLRRLGGMARSVGRGMARAFKFAAIGVGGLIAAIGAATKVYSVQEQANIDLAAAIRLQGHAVDELLPKLKAQAAAIQQETVFGDEFIQTLQAQAINMGVLAESATDATKAALGLAKAYGLETASALRLVTRARVGDTATLKRYGIILDDTLNAEEKYQAILAIGTRNYKLVTDAAKSFSGRMSQLRNAIGDVIEEFGGAVVEGADFNQLVERLKTNAGKFGAELRQKLIPHVKHFKELVEGLMAGGEDRSKAIEDIKETWSKAMDIVGPKLEEWGEVAGRAIWRGFKAAAKTGIEKGLPAIEKSPFVRGPFTNDAMLAAFRGGTPGIAGYAETLAQGGSVTEAMRVGAITQGESLGMKMLGTPANPMAVQEVNQSTIKSE
jgi:hypothetical protein